MNHQNKALLDAHEHFYLIYVRNQTISGMSQQVKNDLLRVMREEFVPGYTYDEWCPHCVGKFLEQVYQHYERWKASHIETFKDDEGRQMVRIKATFPKHKMQ